MTKLFGLFSQKKLYWLWALLTTAVYAYASYAHWYEYLAWKNVGLVVFYNVLQFLCAGAMSLLFFSSGKGELSKSKKLTAFFVGGIGFIALQEILLVLVNVDGLNNHKAIYTAYGVAFTIYTAIFVLTLFRASSKGLGALQKIVGLSGGIIFISLVLLSGWQYIPLQWTYGIYRGVNGYEGEIADSKVFAGFAYSTQKIQPTDDINADVEGHISLAKNEREGIQFLVASSEKGHSVKVSVSDFTDGKGNTMNAEIYTEFFTTVDGFGNIFSDDFADALIPYDAKETQLEKNRVTAFYIETVSDENQSAGEYSATLTIETGDTSEEYEIGATVWDFALPETPASATAMGIFSAKLYELNGFEGSSYGWNASTEQLTDEGQQTLYKAYYDYLLEHRVSAYSIPYDILDERADAYMSDPRVTSFTIPYSDDDEALVKYYEKVSSNPVWAEKGYFYPIDEPSDAEAYARYTEMTDRLERLCPGYNMVTPFCDSEVEIDGEKKSSVELQTGKSSILCGCSDDVTRGNTLEQMYNSRNTVKSELWWYVCCGPTDEHNTFKEDTKWNNMFIYLDSIRHRELFWQEKQFDLTGFLYWDCAYYDRANPWESAITWSEEENAGDGCLVYPGGYIGIDGPVGTVRMKNICDGLEDYDYLTLAEEKFGKEWVDEKIALISTDANNFNLDYKVLADVRNSIGQALSDGNS